MSRLTERDRFWIGVAVLALYAALLLAPLLKPSDAVLALLHEAAGAMHEFAVLVVFYYFATSKGSSDKTALLAKAQPVVDDPGAPA